MAHAKHDAVRRRYGYRCGYCGVPEHDTGGELTVDHYRPVSHGGTDADENLVYACHRCNLYKGDFWPDSADRAAGHRVLHPVRDNLTAHVHEDENGLLEPLSAAGAFHIALLHLNRPPLRENRALRRARAHYEAEIELLTELVALQRRSIEAMRAYLQQLERETPRTESADND